MWRFISGLVVGALIASGVTLWAQQQKEKAKGKGDAGINPTTILDRAEVRVARVEIAPEELLHIDTCWSVALGLSHVDPVRGCDFHMRHLLLALRAGEPYRIARAIGMEVAQSSCAGGPKHDRADSRQSDVERDQVFPA